MIRQGNNIWICEYEDSTGRKHTITLTITGQDSYTYLTVEEKGPTEETNSRADSGVKGYNYYEMKANFRRETYYTPGTN